MNRHKRFNDKTYKVGLRLNPDYVEQKEIIEYLKTLDNKNKFIINLIYEHLQIIKNNQSKD